jgi:predicted nucleic acid-binding protein
VIWVIDASAVVKLAVSEDGHEEIVQILADESDLILAPEFMLVEVGNALWRKCQIREISSEQARAAMAHTLVSFGNLVPTDALIARGLALALELGHPVYDCLYLACAIQRGGTVLTADRRFVAAAGRAGYSGFLRQVGRPS